MKKKILIFIGVTLLVRIMCIVLINVFNFEGNEEENKTNINEIGEDTVNELYSYFLVDNPLGIRGIYTNGYVHYQNFNNVMLKAMIYQYILNNAELSLETLTQEELNSVLNQTGFIPVHKISKNKFEEVLNIMFEPEAAIVYNDFNYSNNISLHFANDYYYVYNNNSTTSSDDYVYKNMIRYAIAENGTVIKIYDNYLRCDVNTNRCYNDEAKESVNSNVVYSENFNISDHIDDLVTYEHTFRLNEENNSYYWDSTQTV